MDGFALAGGTSDRPRAAADAVVLGDLGEQWTFALLQEAFEQLMAGAAWSPSRATGTSASTSGWRSTRARSSPRWSTLPARPPRWRESPAPRSSARRLRALASQPDRTVAMVGDDLWSDVEGAQRAGLQGWLVRTGKFREDVLRKAAVIRPTASSRASPRSVMTPASDGVVSLPPP